MRHRNKVEWTRLDNAAKIFPPTSNEKDTKVFRFSCELHEAVDAELLQQALDETVETFPLYKSVLRRGFFWYYFETSNNMPKIQEESEPVCARIYNENTRNLLFRVSYYKCRVNLEIFHALSDGTGALWFMKTLLYNYLGKKHTDVFADRIPTIDYDASLSQKMDDSFLKHYSGRRISMGEKRPRAYHIRGTRREENRMQVVEGSMSVKEVLNLAHKYDTTLTIYLTALFIYSIYKSMSARGKNHPVVLSVPVNLRQYFESESARNFFSTIFVGYHFGKNSTKFEDLIQSINDSFNKELTPEKLKNHMERIAALEHNVFTRAVPLFMKDYTLRAANRIVDRGITAALSNVGKVKVAEELQPYIKQFSVYTSARRPQICICSYADNLVISFTSPFTDTDVQKSFFRTLSSNGVNIKIATNI